MTYITFHSNLIIWEELYIKKGYLQCYSALLVDRRDQRFKDGNVDDPVVIQNKDGIVDLISNPSTKENIWMSFTVPCKIGTDLEGQNKEPVQISFCDFASAGNTWKQSSRYRVWLVKTLNVIPSFSDENNYFEVTFERDYF